jgi:hypothetical protein
MSLIRLVYTSESRIAEANRPREVGRIVDSARDLNQRNHITGFLLATSGAFAQVLEGDRHAIAETYGRIVVDPRHAAIRLMLEEEVAERAFAHWSMGLAEYDETTNFIFGLYGVSPESDLPQQPVESLLDLASELSRQRA